ncbi:hypothetical protein RchiOBHm_Chr1g0351881 [Rosa chinensis]|uniref:Uncharacterized protein n=1 Tax=Rosa chinensis TaxID=74649 RepID=A0A2P6SGF3_ROSCH|nr:hypothetical protein RchiOBHm_Chr1g0351881 [Rosa chinensis]
MEPPSNYSYTHWDKCNYNLFSVITRFYFLTASVVESLTLSTILSEKGLHGALYVAGEVLFITRPLIYVLFI